MVMVLSAISIYYAPNQEHLQPVVYVAQDLHATSLGVHAAQAPFTH